MRSVRLEMGAGRNVEFDIATDADGPAIFLFSVRRSGSSLFQDITTALCEANRRHLVDIAKFFDADVRAREWQNHPDLPRLLAPGNVYGVFRDMPTAFLGAPLFRSGERLMLVRDPRDALVSEYFALRYSHPLPAGATEDGAARLIRTERQQGATTPIDDYVSRRVRAMRYTLETYLPLLDEGVTLWHYEDVIDDKARWIRELVERLGWHLHPDELRNILSWADVKPEREDPTAFVRQVTPGDHRNKLSPRTIEEITEQLRSVMTRFGYLD